MAVKLFFQPEIYNWTIFTVVYFCENHIWPCSLIHVKVKMTKIIFSTYVCTLLQSIHLVIARDEEVKKIQTQINSGMQLNATNLQNYLSTWDNYREIWEINKDAFIRRYQKLNPQVSSFDADIARLVQ